MRRIIMLMAGPRPADAAQLQGDYCRVTVGKYRLVFDIIDSVPQVLVVNSVPQVLVVDSVLQVLVVDSVLQVLVVGKRNDDDVYRRLR